MQSELGPCVEWDKHLNRGYGRTTHQGKNVYAHRLAYVQAHRLSLGDIDGQVFMHRCDNPRCFNPDHLLLGSREDNMLDMALKGRAPHTKLSKEQVAEMRSLYVRG